MEQKDQQWETVDLNSIKNEDVRSTGPEAVAYWAYEQLDMTSIFRDAGLGENDILRAQVLIMGKLINPVSEKEIHEWFQNRSALDEFMVISNSKISLSSLYRTGDRLLAQKDAIEEALVSKERNLFGLGEKLILYDLTNTCFEGSPSAEDVRRGRSREKQFDRPLITLGIVLDEDGFPKTSRVFPGNVSEPSTLEKIIDDFDLHPPRQLSLIDKRPTVIIDAGIASEDNLELIRSRGLDYVCVDRRRLKEILCGDAHVVHEGESNISMDDPSEVFLFCKSRGRNKKEQAMKNLFQVRFEEGLQKIKDALSRKKRSTIIINYPILGGPA